MPQSPPVRIGVAGALGRMGRAVVQLAADRGDVVVAARFDRPELAGQGADGVLGGLDEAVATADVIIDFSTPEASLQLAQACAAQGGPAVVIGSTGFSTDQLAAIAEAAKAVAVVRSANFSLGVNLLLGFVRQAAKALPAADWDIEVFEAHHRRKVDAPSGAALMLGEAAAQGRGVALDQAAVRVRDGLIGPRPAGAIGFSVMRGGGVVGEHSVSFAAEDEILTLSHSAKDRRLFARGALEAALWTVGRAPGLYDMMDVLGL
jgi:4-hydroxy-tetrahydrodipicolinate reductase